jgi:hypothetical protein
VPSEEEEEVEGDKFESETITTSRESFRDIFQPHKKNLEITGLNYVNAASVHILSSSLFIAIKLVDFMQSVTANLLKYTTNTCHVSFQLCGTKYLKAPIL